MAKSKIKCNACEKEFLKDNREINRNKRVGRNNYCDSKCAAKITKKNLQSPKCLENHKWNHLDPKNRIDEYTPFRHTFKKINNKGRKRCEVTLQNLKEQWEKQLGICPFTGYRMVLKTNSTSGLGATPYDASLDRIDNSKGYEIGNIRFISVMANYARNTFTDEELIQFCKIVTENQL